MYYIKINDIILLNMMLRINESRDFNILHIMQYAGINTNAINRS